MSVVSLAQKNELTDLASAIANSSHEVTMVMGTLHYEKLNWHVRKKFVLLASGY